ncbi:MAG: flagellar basal body-associated protein FliL [Hyphomicrobiales bacterium]|nr:MAG: flagellar basal body-associated protein FliL [Hyphomicrobiales bacterium]
MADEAEETTEGQEGEEQQGSSKKKLILFGLIGLLLLGGGGGAAAYFLGLFGGGDEVATADGAPPPPPPAFFYDLPEITVNLKTIDDKEVFLKLKVALELSDEDMVKQVEPYMPRILDAFQFYLHEVRSTDLEGSAGLFRLKEELHRRINVAIYPAKVGDVLFKEVLVQ